MKLSIWSSYYMELKIAKMTENLANQAIDWKYEGEYSEYNNPPKEKMLEKIHDECI